MVDGVFPNTLAAGLEVVQFPVPRRARVTTSVDAVKGSFHAREERARDPGSLHRGA